LHNFIWSKSRSSSLTEVLVVIDTLNPLCDLPSPALPLPLFLSTLVTPAVSLVAGYHSDVPPAPIRGGGGGNDRDEYAPHPLATLTHLATGVLRVTGLQQAAARRRARDRSLPEPGFGLDERREGVLIGLCEPAASNADRGLILEMELRRRSGRAVIERFVLMVPVGDRAEVGKISLMAEHPLFRGPEDDETEAVPGTGEDDVETTFSLGLTEKQRRDREGIVLPYFDAQTDIGAGEGGRILYEMGREDDFDDEEDEI
jgi:elongator complex protein 5